MDKQYSVKFFTSFVDAMQKLCREYLDFDQGVELSGYLAVEIDNFKKERYVLSELVQSTGNVISESYCTKAFKTLRKELPPRVSSDSENITPRKTYGMIHRPHRQSKPADITIDLRESPEREIPSLPRYQQSPASRGPAMASPVRWQNRNVVTPKRINHFSSSVGSPPRMRNMEALRSPNASRVSPNMSRVSPNMSRISPSVSNVGPGQQTNQIQPRRLEQTPSAQPSWTPPRITSVQSLRSPQPDPVIPSSPQSTPATISAGQKRPSESNDSVASPSSKKDKLDENLEALMDLANMAKEISDESQSENKSNCPTPATSTAVPPASPTVASSSQITQPASSEAVPTENIRLPLPSDVKKEQDSNVPCLVIDNANDEEISSGSDSTFNTNQSVETFVALNTLETGSFAGDAPGTSGTSFDAGTMQMDTNVVMKQECLISAVYDDDVDDVATAAEQAGDQLVCCICKNTFPTKCQLEKHLSDSHGERSLQCSNCPLTFISAYDLENHCARQHQQMDHACKDCGFYFVSAADLRQHSLKEHSYETSVMRMGTCHSTRLQPFQERPTSKANPFACSYCSKDYFCQDSLSRHEQMCKSIHASFICPTCGHCSSDKKSLSDHMKTIHKGVMYVCNLCGAKYSWSTGLAKHKKSCHP